jgi:hypothetical protein
MLSRRLKEFVMTTIHTTVTKIAGNEEGDPHIEGDQSDRHEYLPEELHAGREVGGVVPEPDEEYDESPEEYHRELRDNRERAREVRGKPGGDPRGRRPAARGEEGERRVEQDRQGDGAVDRGPAEEGRRPAMGLPLAGDVHHAGEDRGPTRERSEEQAHGERKREQVHINGEPHGIPISPRICTDSYFTP